MNKKDASTRKALLDSAREMANTEGVQAINIRALAKRAGIATGTVYNYFSSKDDILLALTEEYWRSSLMEMDKDIAAGPFTVQLASIYLFLQQRIAASGNMLMSSLVNVGSTGRQRMDTQQQVLLEKILLLMQQDGGIAPGVWSDTFTQESCAGFILLNLMSHLRTGAPNIDFLLEMLRRTLY